MFDSSSKLLAACVAARQDGKDFPTIWQKIAKRHPAVLGIPVSVRIGDETVLSIPLLSGQRLIFGEAGFWLD